jgi:predicted ATPase
VLLRVLRRIRDTTQEKPIAPQLQLKPDEVSILYFEPQGDGTTKVHTIRVSRHGDFMDPWPRGFFEEREKDLFGE